MHAFCILPRRAISGFSLVGGARARHVWPSHKMQRTFLNWRKSVDLVSARALNNQARYKYHQSKLIPSHQVRNTFLLFGSAQFLEFWLSKLVYDLQVFCLCLSMVSN